MLVRSVVFLVSVTVGQLACESNSASSDLVSQSRDHHPAATDSAKAGSAPALQSSLLGEEHFFRANNLKSTARYEEALEEYEAAIAAGYDTAGLRYELGALLTDDMKRPDAGIEQFRKAIEIDENHFRSHVALAQLLLADGRYEDAMREIDIVERLSPEAKSEGYFALARAKALDGLGRLSEALIQYESYLEQRKGLKTSDIREARERARAIRSELGLELPAKSKDDSVPRH